MKKCLSYLILLCLLIWASGLCAQVVSSRIDSVQQKLTEAVTNYYKRYPQEKIFVHTDETEYISGQTLWYKVYAMAYGKPSQLSKIVYVRLLDANGRLLMQNKLPVNNSTAYGNINLPDTLPTGYYQLQAYTAWMLNFGKDGLFNEIIYIQNSRSLANAAPPAPSAKNYHIDFYPEGGDLVDGNICNIAFKATDQNGLPAAVYGQVLDNNKTSRAKLVTLHDGMGSFELETNANVAYTAQVHFPDKSVRSITLPLIKKTGIAMRVNAAPAGEIEVKIANAGQQQEYKDIIIMAVQNNGQSAAYPIKLNRGINVIGIKKSDFITGILRLSVFDDTGLPLAERIVFVDNGDALKLSLNPDTLSFKPKGVNVFSLNISGAAKANLSVAITDAQTGDGPGNNIASYFLMSSELRGAINQAGWYFKNNSDTLKQQLDLVMLTNGWRRFKWDSVLNARPRVLTYAVAGTQFIAGKIEGFKNGERLKYIISSSDSDKYTGLVEPDTAGRFMLKDYNKQGTTNLLFEVVNEKNRKQTAKITLITPPADTALFSADTLTCMPATLTATGIDFLSTLATLQAANFTANGIKLKTVAIKARKLSPTEQLMESHVQRLIVDNAITLNLVGVDVSTTHLLEYIQGRFPGLRILVSVDGQAATFNYHGANFSPSSPSGSGGTSTDVNRGAPPAATPGRAKGEPYYYVDEGLVELSDIANMPLSDVALIRFVPPPVYFAPLNGGISGALLIYTKRFGDERIMNGNTNSNFDQYIFNGYSVTREYASPNYSITQPNPAADYRTTLFWAHDLTTDDKGTVKLRFYNSDKAKHYRVIIQAIDAEGRVGSFNEEF